MPSDRQIAKRLKISYDTFLRWRKDKPLLYAHIKEGFELKNLIEGLDDTLKAILNQTEQIKLKNTLLDDLDENLCKVVLFKVNKTDPFLINKSYIWVKTKETSINILTYKDELITNQSLDTEALIDMNNHKTCDKKDKSDWIISNNIKEAHIDEFFTWYKINI